MTKIFGLLLLACLCESPAMAQFLLENHSSKSGDSPDWKLVDKKHNIVVSLDNNIMDPQIEEIQNHAIGASKIWVVKLSSAAMGTSILTQIDYALVLRQATSDAKVALIAFEPIGLIRSEGGKVIYKRARDFRLDLAKKKIYLGGLDEFSVKTIEIR